MIKIKIIKKDNKDSMIYRERVIAENVDKEIGTIMVDLYNEKHWNTNSNFYLRLVNDSYELRDGFSWTRGKINRK